MAYEYKCVSGPTIVAVKNTKVRDQAVKAFEDIMNIEAAQGWEFVGIDEFHVSEPQGLFSRKRIYVPAKILVFRRQKVSSVLAEAIKARSGRAEAEATSQLVAPLTNENPLAVADLLPTKTIEEVSEVGSDRGKNSLKSIVEKIKQNKN